MVDIANTIVWWTFECHLPFHQQYSLIFLEIICRQASSAGSMFSRFAQSAKSVMEESFLMVTEESIIEFKSNKLNIGSGTGEIRLILFLSCLYNVEIHPLFPTNCRYQSHLQ